MKSLLSFFRSNKGATISMLSAVLVIVAAGAINGCTLGDIIQHDVPRDMQRFNGGEAKVSLNDAPFVLEGYMDEVHRNLRQYTEANDTSQRVYALLSTVVTVGLSELRSSALPGAGILSGLLLGVTGLMIRKPGTAREIAAEKMASFNKGQEVALQSIEPILTAAQLRTLMQEIKDAT